MSGGKGKSHGGKARPKGASDGARQQVSHSAKAGLQVSNIFIHTRDCCFFLARFGGLTVVSADLRNRAGDEKSAVLDACYCVARVQFAQVCRQCCLQT